MHKTTRIALLAAAASIFGAGGALAEVGATATTDLNIRSGPGPEYPPIAVIDAGGDAVISSCLQGSKWCQVTYNGTTGWSYSDYLAVNTGGQQVVVTNRTEAVEVPTVTREEAGINATVGAAGGAITGALIGGPVGAAVGGAAGAVAGAIASPPQEVRTYVRENPADPVYLQGEVVVGAGVPETVELQQIPDYEYRYVYVNEQPVLVEPSSRRIVYVYR